MHHEDTDSVELVEIEEVRSTVTLFGTDDPKVALVRMAAIADELVDVIEQQKFYVRIGSRKYVTCPGWKTAGGMLGLSPYTVWTKPNEAQDGYVARVEVRTLDERTIAAAEAECSRDEPNWRNRPKHALRSMAETRATSRALRGPLEQVFALGGYEGTAAEEMPAESASVEPEHGRVPAEHRPTPEQVATLNETLARLRELAPTVDWGVKAREIAGVPSFDYVTKTMADRVLEELHVHLANLGDDEDPLAA